MALSKATPPRRWPPVPCLRNVSEPKPDLANPIQLRQAQARFHRPRSPYAARCYYCHYLGCGLNDLGVAGFESKQQWCKDKLDVEEQGVVERRGWVVERVEEQVELDTDGLARRSQGWTCGAEPLSLTSLPAIERLRSWRWSTPRSRSTASPGLTKDCG